MLTFNMEQQAIAAIVLWWLESDHLLHASDEYETSFPRVVRHACGETQLDEVATRETRPLKKDSCAEQPLSEDLEDAGPQDLGKEEDRLV